MDIHLLHSDILSKLQTGVVVHGPDTRILFSNPRANELLGLSDDQMRGKAVTDFAWHFFDESGRAMALADYPVNRVITSGQAVQGIVLGVNASAHTQTVWLLVSAFPQHNADGQLSHVLVDFHDISALKAAQENQLERESFTLEVIDSMSEHVAVLNKDAKIVLVNLAWREFGLNNGTHPDVQAGVGINYFDLCPAVNAAQAQGTDARTGIQAVLSGQQDSFQLEYPCHSPVEKRWFRMNVRRLKGKHGGAVISHINITEQRKTELEAQRNMQLLLGSIEAIDEAFVIYDADERLVFCNEKYRKLYPQFNHLILPGTRFEDIIRAGAKLGFYSESSANLEKWVQERLAAFRSGDQTRIQRVFDGRVVRAIERKMADGHTVGFRIDITELVTATDAALAASRAKDRFLATMSHEIRTPMNGVLGMAQMLLMPDLSESDRRNYARTILSSGQTLLTLLNDILDLSKIEAGKFQLDAQVFEPESVLTETRMLFAGAAQAKNLKLDARWRGHSNQRYQADSHRLRQMISNLIGNAIKFTSKGSIQIQAIEIECDADTALLEFSVSDTGIGISEDKLGILFKPFSQADTSTTRNFGGTGLGLSIVSKLAKAMGGDAGVQSKPGQGSRFWFRVRVQTVTEDQDSRHTGRSAHIAAKIDIAASQLSGRVWVAEDNPVNTIVIRALLNTLGVTMTLLTDGQQAVEAITKSDAANRPDLILMDLHMPVMDGYTATQHIRHWESDQQQPRLPIIALTADAFEEDRQHCLAVGMDSFLTKPISIDALKAALVECLPATSKMPLVCVQPVLKPVDIQRFSALMNELTPLLKTNKFAAITHFETLQTLVAGTELADEIDALKDLLQEMRFDVVLDRLQQITMTHGGL